MTSKISFDLRDLQERGVSTATSIIARLVPDTGSEAAPVATDANAVIANSEVSVDVRTADVQQQDGTTLRAGTAELDLVQSSHVQAGYAYEVTIVGAEKAWRWTGLSIPDGDRNFVQIINQVEPGRHPEFVVITQDELTALVGRLPGAAAFVADIKRVQFDIPADANISITTPPHMGPAFHEIRGFTTDADANALGEVEAVIQPNGIRIERSGFYSLDLQLSMQLRSSSFAAEWGISLLVTNGVVGAGEVVRQSWIFSEHTEATSNVESFIENVTTPIVRLNEGDFVYCALSFVHDSDDSQLMTFAVSPAPTESFILLRRYIGIPATANALQAVSVQAPLAGNGSADHPLNIPDGSIGGEKLQAGVVPGRAGAFTEDDENKLDNIDEGAQVNRTPDQVKDLAGELFPGNAEEDGTISYDAVAKRANVRVLPKRGALFTRATAQVPVGGANYALAGNPALPANLGDRTRFSLSGGGNAGSFVFTWGDLGDPIAPGGRFNAQSPVRWVGDNRVVYVARGTDGNWRVGSDDVGPLTLSLRYDGSNLEDAARRDNNTRWGYDKLPTDIRQGGGGGGGLATVATGPTIDGDGTSGSPLDARGMEAGALPVANTWPEDSLTDHLGHLYRNVTTAGRNVLTGIVAGPGGDVRAGYRGFKNWQFKIPVSRPNPWLLEVDEAGIGAPPAQLGVKVHDVTSDYYGEDVLTRINAMTTGVAPNRTFVYGGSDIGTDASQVAVGDHVQVAVFNADLRTPRTVTAATRSWVLANAKTTGPATWAQEGNDDDIPDDKLSDKIARTDAVEPRIPSGNTFPTNPAPTAGQRFELTARQTFDDPASMTVGRSGGGIGDQWGWWGAPGGFGAVDKDNRQVFAVVWYDNVSTNALGLRNRLAVWATNENSSVPETVSVGGTDYPLEAVTGLPHTYRSTNEVSTRPWDAGDEESLQVTLADKTKVFPDRVYEPHVYTYTGVTWRQSYFQDAEDIRDELQSLTGADRLSARAIQDLPSREFSQTLVDEPVEGLALTDLNTLRANNFRVLNFNGEPFDLDDVTQGEFHVRVALTIGSSSGTTQNPIGFGAHHSQSVEFTAILLASDLKTAAVWDAGASTGGQQIGSDVPLNRAAVVAGDVECYLARNANNELGFVSLFRQGSAAVGNATVAVDLYVAWSPTDPGSAAEAGDINLTSELAPTNYTTGANTYVSTGWVVPETGLFAIFALQNPPSSGVGSTSDVLPIATIASAAQLRALPSGVNEPSIGLGSLARWQTWQLDQLYFRKHSTTHVLEVFNPGSIRIAIRKIG